MALALVLSAAPAGAGVDARTAFQQVYNELVVAMRTRNPDIIRPFFTADYVTADENGQKLSIDQMLVKLQKLPAGALDTLATQVEDVQVQGRVARVTQTGTMSMQQRGQDGRMHTLQIADRSTDTWVNQGGGSTWQMKATQDLGVVMLVDGKPIPANR